ncbi:MAG TPA: carbamoyl-phosphate-synthetase [Bacteroidia bacterium]|nr:carbamoyl-phosphate-synthetase [Bacteroidia bacterium]
MQLSGKRLLFLGGADIQVPAIKKAQELGAWVITCDYLPDNPGHKVSNEYHNVSTTDKEKVLSLAETLKIDGISAYASDPAALTAAYVSEKMGLPGNSYAAVAELADKVTFRKLQARLGIPSPRLIETADPEMVLQEVKNFRHGAIIKPVDTSGSKGIYRILPGETETEVLLKINDALSFSRVKKVVLEEFLKRKDFLMSGDFMIDKGKIVFYCFGDVHFNDAITGLVPRSISLPASNQNPEFFARVIADLQKMLDALHIRTGVFNCDVIEDEEGRAVVIDIGARNGGNLFNDIISLHTGEDLIGQTILQTLGYPVSIRQPQSHKGYFAHNVIHSMADGIFKAVIFHPEIEKCIFYRMINVKEGDPVKRFIHSGNRLGLVLLKFESFGQMHRMLGNIYEYVRVEVAAQARLID